VSDFGLCKTLKRVTQDNKSYVMTGNTGTRRSAGIPSRSARRARAVQKRWGVGLRGINRAGVCSQIHGAGGRAVGPKLRREGGVFSMPPLMLNTHILVWESALPVYLLRGPQHDP